MLKIFAKFIIWLLGWKVQGRTPKMDKYLAISAPHTSNMDFVLGALYYLSIGEKANFLIKKELFFFPLSPILKALGGTPVDRKNSTNIVDQMVENFKSKKRFRLIITPEGTRKKVTIWKKGFYHIGYKANVPVVMSYFDYKKKLIGIFEPFYLGDNMEEEIKKIKLFFKDVHPRYPEKFSIGKI